MNSDKKKINSEKEIIRQRRKRRQSILRVCMSPPTSPTRGKETFSLPPNYKLCAAPALSTSWRKADGKKCICRSTRTRTHTHKINSFDFAHAINWISTCITFESAYFRQTFFFFSSLTLARSHVRTFRVFNVDKVGISEFFLPSTAFSFRFFYSLQRFLFVFFYFNGERKKWKREWKKKDKKKWNETNGNAHENVPASKRITQSTQPAQSSFSRTCLNDGLFAISILFSVSASISCTLYSLLIYVGVGEWASVSTKSSCIVHPNDGGLCLSTNFSNKMRAYNINTRFIRGGVAPFQQRILITKKMHAPFVCIAIGKCYRSCFSRVFFRFLLFSFFACIFFTSQK